MSAQNDISFYVGQSFNSFDEFQRHLLKYEIEKRQKFSIRASQPIKTSSKIFKHKINLSLRYYEVKYQCIHRSGFKSSGSGLRKRSTLRMNCPALIKLRVSCCGAKLEVKQFDEQHEGHELTEEVFEHLPHNRKPLKKDIVEAEDYIKLDADNKKSQRKFFSEGSAVPILSDLYSNASNLWKKQNNNLNDVVEVLEDTYNCNVSVLYSDANEFKGLYFSTETMRCTMQAWPERIIIDGPCKLIDDSSAIFLVLIEDSEGHTEIVGVCIAASDDIDTMTFFLNCFKSENISVYDQIKCIMGDKDFMERDVIEEVFLGIPTYISLFHCMKTFKREIKETKLGISKHEKILSLEYIKKLIQASNDSEYKQIYKQFAKQVPETVLIYFNDNWHNINDKWRITNSLLNETTSIHLRAINGKVKEILKKSSSMSEFVKGFFIHLESHYYTRDHFVADHVQKRLISYFKENSCEHKYEMYLTRYAFEYILKQISLISSVSTIANEDEVCIVKSSSGQIKTTINHCECQYYTSLLLPCKHILAVRTAKNIPKFDENICDLRWTREYYINAHRAIPKNSISTNLGITVTDSERAAPDAWVARKKQKMYAVTDSLCHLMSNASDRVFDYRLRVLRRLEFYWKHGIEVSVLSLNGQTEKCENPEVILDEAGSTFNLHSNHIENHSSQTSILNQEAEGSAQNISVRHSNEFLQDNDTESEIRNFATLDGEDSKDFYVMENEKLQETSSRLSDLISVKPKKRSCPSRAENTQISPNKKKKTIPSVFEKKQDASKAELLLKCALAKNNTDMLSAILRQDYLVSKNDLEPNHELINAALIDERVNISILTPYMEKEAFTELQQILQMKSKNTDCRCSSCNDPISTQTSVCCDSCLQWHHFDCVALLRIINKSWFCYECL